MTYLSMKVVGVARKLHMFNPSMEERVGGRWITNIAGNLLH